MSKAPKLGTGKRFEKLDHHLAHEKGVYDPAGLAAAIGRKKYGAEKMGKLSHHEMHAHGGAVEDCDLCNGGMMADGGEVDDGDFLSDLDVDESTESEAPDYKRRIGDILRSTRQKRTTEDE